VLEVAVERKSEIELGEISGKSQRYLSVIITSAGRGLMAIEKYSNTYEIISLLCFCCAFQ
jgi:hypothetical protein